VAGTQAPDLTIAEPCRRPDRRRSNYTCDDRAAARSQQIISRFVLGKRISFLIAQPDVWKLVQGVITHSSIPI
jgi:hypothetical protein